MPVVPFMLFLMNSMNGELITPESSLTVRATPACPRPCTGYVQDVRELNNARLVGQMACQPCVLFVLSFLLALCMCLTLVPVTVLADDDIQQINDTAVQAITPGSDVSVLSVVKPDDAYYRTYEFYVDGEEINTQIVKNGDTLYEPPVTAPAGKTFIGWKPAVDFGTVSGVTKTETITVAAQFKDGYHVTFLTTDGSVLCTATVTPNGTLTDLPDEVKNYQPAGKRVTAWKSDNGEFTTSTVVTGDITLTPECVDCYWVTFDTQGGSGVPSQYVDQGNTLTLANVVTPTRTGYTFKGWSLTQDGTTVASVIPTADTTLYAIWEASGVKYTVAYWGENANDDKFETFLGSEEKTAPTGTSVTASNFNSGSNFSGWTVSGLGYTATSKIVTMTANLCATDGKTATANYDAYCLDHLYYMFESFDQTSPANGNNRVKHNGKYYDKSDAYSQDANSEGGTWNQKSITGMTAKGTNTENLKYSEGFLGSYATERNVFLYYDRLSYELTWNNYGSTTTDTLKYGAQLTNKGTPARPAGFSKYATFKGWYTVPVAQITNTTVPFDFTGKTMPASNMTLFAYWVEAQIKVTFIVGDKSFEASIPYGTKAASADAYDTAITAISTSGKTLLKWVDNTTGSAVDVNQQLYTNTTLRAVFKGDTHKVTYVVAPGAGSVTDNRSYEYDALAVVKSGSGITLPANKVFLGWTTVAGGTTVTKYPGSTVQMKDQDITLYAVYGDKASTVQLTYMANGGKEADITDTDIANNKPVTLRDENTFTRTGYTLTGWNTQPDGSGKGFALGASARVDNLGSGNVLYAQWAPNTDTKYTVEFYYQNDDGATYPSTASKTDPRTGTTDTTVSVTNADKEAKEDGKYVYDTTAANVESGTVTADGSLVLKLYFKLNQFQLTINYVYEDGSEAATSHSSTLTVGEDYSVNSPEIEGYTPSKDTVSGKMPANNVEVTVTYTKRSDLSYTVHYYWNGTTTSVKESKTVPGQTFNASVTESPIAIEGYTAVSNASQTITIDASDNVINFYYYKNVELTANSDEATYDGEEHSVSGFTGAPADADFSAITVGAKGINVGTYPANFADDTEGTVDTNKKYIVTKANNGQLTIKPAEVTVTIKGNTKTETYDGTEYTVTGYTIESISNDLYSADNVTLKDGAKAEAKGTNAGDYMMGLTKESFENKNTNFKVTFDVEDGKLTIAKRDVTVTGESATKVYNGQTQEINGYTVDNLVKGHEMTGVIYSAKGKDPGKYDGAFTGRQIVIKDAAGTDVTANYNVKPVIGVLTITQPSHPTRPSTPTKDVTSVKTADGSQMTLWMSMMLASAAGIVFLGKKRKEEQ